MESQAVEEKSDLIQDKERERRFDHTNVKTNSQSENDEKFKKRRKNGGNHQKRESEWLSFFSNPSKDQNSKNAIFTLKHILNDAIFDGLELINKSKKENNNLWADLASLCEALNKNHASTIDKVKNISPLESPDNVIDLFINENKLNLKLAILIWIIPYLAKTDIEFILGRISELRDKSIIFSNELLSYFIEEERDEASMKDRKNLIQIREEINEKIRNSENYKSNQKDQGASNKNIKIAESGILKPKKFREENKNETFNGKEDKRN